jgi:hypothetical protein
MKALAIVVCLLASAPLAAQPASPASATTQDEGAFHAELRREGESLRHECGSLALKAIGGCVVALATEHPLHVSFGTLAPQNGMGFGPALVMHRTPNENWKLNWSADVAGAFSGAWRAGAYLKIVRTAVKRPGVSGGGVPSASSSAGIHPYPVFDVYAQIISLPKLAYFGLGPDTLESGKSFFGMRETIIGASTIYPVAGPGPLAALKLALLGEINNRLVDIRSSDAGGAPSIEQLYSDATAPGLFDQPGVIQLGEGVRIQPALANGRLRLNYVTRFQQFVASDASSSFRRWTLDLGHELPIYGRSRAPSSRDTNNPNDCSIDPGTSKCPAVSSNRGGTINLRILVSRSGVSEAAAVPFYFQQTIGGSDINGDRGLASYDDYRFRGPKLLLLQQSFEHAFGKWPVGVWIATDQGRVSRQGDQGDAGPFRKTFAAGLTVRAGGFPVAQFSWATGGSEGHHVALTISTSVLGGSTRPSLY